MVPKKKKQVACRAQGNRLSLLFNSHSGSKKTRGDVLKILDEKHLQSRIPQPAKLSFCCVGRINAFQTCVVLENVSPSLSEVTRGCAPQRRE